MDDTLQDRSLRRRRRDFIGGARGIPLVFLAAGSLVAAVTSLPLVLKFAQKDQASSFSNDHNLLERGRYLATIGACEACHTAPDVSHQRPTGVDKQEQDKERLFRTDPDWFRYLDPAGSNKMAGGVPFILRFSGQSSGLVVSPNLTPDLQTGLGEWSLQEIAEVIRSGRRRDGTALFLFPPHTQFKHLASDDAVALALYLKSLPPKRSLIWQDSLPFRPEPARAVSQLHTAPQGRTSARAKYLMDALVGCRECHSYRANNGVLMEFAGGDPADPFQGVFRLGPDLPLRPDEKGFAVFPYPGYAVLYATNLTRFGARGDLSAVDPARIVRAIRRGVSVLPDEYGRARPLSHVMLWQFYDRMVDDDAYAIANYLKQLPYVDHVVQPRVDLYGEGWTAAFERVFGEKPTPQDSQLFGRKHVAAASEPTVSDGFRSLPPKDASRKGH